MDTRTYNIVGGAGIAAIGFAFLYVTAGTVQLPASFSITDEIGQAAQLFDASAFWKFYASLFAIMNPLVVIPMFVAMTERQPAAYRNRLARATTLTVMVALLVAAVFGREILGFSPSASVRSALQVG